MAKRHPWRWPHSETCRHGSSLQSVQGPALGHTCGESHSPADLLVDFFRSNFLVSTFAWCLSSACNALLAFLHRLGSMFYLYASTNVFMSSSACRSVCLVHTVSVHLPPLSWRVYPFDVSIRLALNYVLHCPYRLGRSVAMVVAQCKCRSTLHLSTDICSQFIHFAVFAVHLTANSLTVKCIRLVAVNGLDLD